MTTPQDTHAPIRIFAQVMTGIVAAMVIELLLLVYIPWLGYGLAVSVFFGCVVGAIIAWCVTWSVRK